MQEKKKKYTYFRLLIEQLIIIIVFIIITYDIGMIGENSFESAIVFLVGNVFVFFVSRKKENNERNKENNEK